jgi:hypothetical protein
MNDLTFVIFDISCNPIAIEFTKKSILNFYEDANLVILNFKDNISKTINQIFDKQLSQNIYFIKAGKQMPKGILNKYERFRSNGKDIFYASEHRVPNFIDNSLSGLYISSDAFKKIGKFSEALDFIRAKILWAATAINCGYKLKSIVGAKTI